MTRSTGIVTSPVQSVDSSVTSPSRRIRTSRVRSTSDDDGTLAGRVSAVMSEVSQDESNDDDDDYDDNESYNSENEDPLSAAVNAIHTSSLAMMQSGQSTTDDGVDSSYPFSELYTSTYRDGREDGSRSGVQLWRKSLAVATGSNTGHVSFMSFAYLHVVEV